MQMFHADINTTHIIMFIYDGVKYLEVGGNKY